MPRLSKRAARRRRWRIAIAVTVVAGLIVGWRVVESRRAQPAPPQTATVATSVSVPTPSTIAPAAPQQTQAQPVQASIPIEVLDAAAVREAKWAEVRRQTIEVQQRLRKDAAAQRARDDAQQNGTESRCVEGRKMKRISNGWVDDGSC
jgi:type IV secretory pathway VirB10-like protein